jgi:phage recombination protein Bet
MTTTGNAVATRGASSPTALAIRPGQSAWDEFQLAALAQIGLENASDGDRAVFLHQCQRTGLDPFARQIYCIGRNEKKNERRGNAWVETWSVKWTIQTGIDGWRVIRGRAEKREGVRAALGRAVWYDHDGAEHKVWVSQDPPAACEITLTVRDAAGAETPYTSVLQFREYVQLKNDKPVAQWASKPAHMLEKCTEADVYRKAFPQDFSGIDLDDAMPPPEAAPAGPAAIRVTAEDITSRPPRPRPTGSPGAPTAQGNDSAASTASGAEPEDPTTAPGADAADSTGGPAPQQAARPTGAQLGKLGKLLKQVPLGTPDDDAAFLHWQAGRPVTPTSISRDECAAAAGYLEKALEGAQGNADEAASMIWAAYKAAHEQASDG